MKEIKYVEYENGMRCVVTEGKTMDIIEEINKEKFESHFPDVSTYGLEQNSPIYLENGIVCIDKEWNGERYIVKTEGKELEIVPVYKENDGDFEIMGYYEA